MYTIHYCPACTCIQYTVVLLVAAETQQPMWCVDRDGTCTYVCVRNYTRVCCVNPDHGIASTRMSVINVRQHSMVQSSDKCMVHGLNCIIHKLCQQFIVYDKYTSGELFMFVQLSFGDECL